MPSADLDTILIDHPEIEPVDGRVLTNLLVVNDEVVGPWDVRRTSVM